MTTLFRVLLLVTWAAASVAIYRCCLVPYQCNVATKQARNRTLHIVQTKRLDSARVARENIARLEKCLARFPHNVGLSMILAANYRYVGAHERAIKLYRDALRYDHRPELYFNLGETFFLAGDVESAVESFTTACLQHPKYLDDLPASLQRQVRHQVDLYQTRLQRRTNMPSP